MQLGGAGQASALNWVNLSEWGKSCTSYRFHYSFIRKCETENWFQEMLLSLSFIHYFLNMHFVSSLLYHIIGAPTYILVIFVVK